MCDKTSFSCIYFKRPFSFMLKRCYSRLATALAKKNIVGLSLQQLQHELATIPEARKYTAQQVWEHMYRRGITDFQDMTNLSKTLRSELEARYKIHYGFVQVVSTLRSTHVGIVLISVITSCPKYRVTKPVNGLLALMMILELLSSLY